MPNVGSAGTLQVVIAEGREAAILDDLKKSTNADLINSYHQIIATLEKYLTEARQKMLDTDRAALRQEIRKVEAILSAKDYTVLVVDMPEVRFLGNKKNNDLVREAKLLLQSYNTLSAVFYKPTKAEIISRGLDPDNLSQYPNSTVNQQEIDDFVKNLLKQNDDGTGNPGLSINKIELDDKNTIDKSWLYAGAVLLIILYLRKRRK